MYTFTPEQDAVIIARWNELANEKSQLRPGQAHLVVGDSFHVDISDYGDHYVVIPARYSKTGDATAFHIADDEVTFDG